MKDLKVHTPEPVSKCAKVDAHGTAPDTKVPDTKAPDTKAPKFNVGDWVIWTDERGKYQGTIKKIWGGGGGEMALIVDWAMIADRYGGDVFLAIDDRIAVETLDKLTKHPYLPREE